MKIATEIRWPRTATMVTSVIKSMASTLCKFLPDSCRFIILVYDIEDEGDTSTHIVSNDLDHINCANHLIDGAAYVVEKGSRGIVH